MNTAFNFNQIDQQHAEMLAITDKLVEILRELDTIVKKTNPVTPKFKVLKGGRFKRDIKTNNYGGVF